MSHHLRSFPRLPMGVTGVPNTTSSPTTTAVGHRHASIGRVPRTGTVTAVWWTAAGISGAGLNEMTVSLRPLVTSSTPATPHPTDYISTNSYGSSEVNNAHSNTSIRVSLIGAASVTAGQTIAVTVRKTTHSNTVNVAGFADDGAANTGWMPYALQDTTGTWSAITSKPLVVLEYSDGVCLPLPGTTFFSRIDSLTLSPSTTPDVIGTVIEMDETIDLHHVWLWADLDADATVKVVTPSWNQASPGSGTVLAEAPLVSTVRHSDNAGIMFATFPDPPRLTANTRYRIVVEPAGSLTLYSAVATDSRLLNILPWGSLGYLTTAKDPTGDGSWTNHNGSGLFASLFCGILYEPVPGASGKRRRLMQQPL